MRDYGNHDIYQPPFEAPPSLKEKKSGVKVNIILFLLTAVTTITAGAVFLEGVDPFSEPYLLYKGIPFAFPLMLILGIHEMAHYLASRRWGLRVTLPYFIPAPTIIGTMGAVIKIKSPIYDRQALLDIGVSGPLAGFFTTLPIAYIGLKLSSVQQAVPDTEGLSLGSSLLFNYMVKMILPAAGENSQIILHPVAFAAWVGFLVTALNLMPIGQLDGGHIICALFGRHHRSISLVGLVVLLPLGLLWPGWLLWAFLLTIIGWRHPPTLNDGRLLSRRQRFLGILSMGVFVLTFTPVPFSLTVL